jgi:hypothetical protein
MQEMFSFVKEARVFLRDALTFSPGCPIYKARALFRPGAIRAGLSAQEETCVTTISGAIKDRKP